MISGKGAWPIRSALTHGVSAFYRNRAGHSEQAIVTDLFFGSGQQSVAELSTSIEGTGDITATLAATAQLLVTIEVESDIAPLLTTEAQLSMTSGSELSLNVISGDSELSTEVASECQLLATLHLFLFQRPVRVLPANKPRNRIVLVKQPRVVEL